MGMVVHRCDCSAKYPSFYSDIYPLESFPVFAITVQLFSELTAEEVISWMATILWFKKLSEQRQSKKNALMLKFCP